MNPRVYVLAAAICALPLAGCASGATLPASTPTSTNASATFQPIGGTLTYPAGGGYTASMAYGSNNAAAGVVAATTTITNPPASLVPMDVPPGTMLIAYELTLNQNVRFTVWNGFLSSVVVPNSVQLSGRTISDYGYDLTVGVAEGSDPSTAVGSTVTFSAGRAAVTLLANHTYLMVLAIQ